MIVVHGAIRFEFDVPDETAQVVSAGQVLVLPPNTRCRAYSWPRDRDDPAIFVAVYPVHE
jgi:hypothetical protein